MEGQQSKAVHEQRAQSIAAARAAQHRESSDKHTQLPVCQVCFISTGDVVRMQMLDSFKQQ